MLDSSIKNLIFDLGGVLLNLHLDRTQQAFARLAGCSVPEIRSRIESSAFFDEYEKGIHTDTEFRRCLRVFLTTDASDAEIDTAWNAMLGDIPAERLLLLERLRSQYRIFLLSNTNQIHLDHFSNAVRTVNGGPSLDSYFEKAYYSHQLKMRKPDREIFEHVLKENKLRSSETLFLDDNRSNIVGAELAGIRTFHVDQPQMVISLFS